METITFTEAQLDAHAEAISREVADVICKIAEAVLEPADAKMFLTELDAAFGVLNRDYDKTCSPFPMSFNR